MKDKSLANLPRNRLTRTFLFGFGAFLAFGCGPRFNPTAASMATRSPVVTWETALGPGGARVPELLPLPDQAGPGGVSRLRGAVFLAGGQDVLFIGTAPAGEPRLTPEELLDSFVVSYRAIESRTAPAMSIDPTSEQIARGLEEGDQMPVRYIDCDGTAMGEVMFEGDRMMKTLGSGRDNLTRQPVTSRVPDYKDQLAMGELDQRGDYTPWTRFWIEQELDEVELSSDGSTVLVRPKMRVRARAQVPRKVTDAAGKVIHVELIDADDSKAAPSARQFAKHMTDHFEDARLPLDFAREFPTYRKLVVHAALVSLAEAVWTNRQGQPRPPLDSDWILVDHVLPPFTTTPKTPATIATRETSSGQTIRIDQIRGGVDLAPRNQYPGDHREADELLRLVREAIAREPGRRHWQIRHRGQTYEVYAQSAQQKSLEVWQVDQQVGQVKVVRVLGAKGGGPKVGANWSLRVPRAVFSDETANFKELGKLRRSATVRGIDGQPHLLGQVGQAQLPGQPVALSYSSGSGEMRERRLLLFKDRWVYIDGEVRFVSINGGPIQWQLSPGTFVLEFSAQPPNRIERIRTADDEQTLSWDGARLTKIQSTSGPTVELTYDADGRLSGSRGSNGSRVEYRYASDGFLTVVVDDKGNCAAYTRSPGGREVTGMSANFVATAPRAESRALFNTEAQPDWDKAVAIARENSNKSQVFFAVRPAQAGTGKEYEVVIGGEPDEAGEAIALYRKAVEIEGFNAADPRRVRQLLETHPAVRGRGRIVLIGSSEVVGPLSVALREGRQPSSVLTASDPQRAVTNLRRPGGKGVQFLAVEDRLPASVCKSLAGIAPGNERGHFVVVAGHNGDELKARLEGWRTSLAGKAVVLVCCGAHGDGLPGLVMDSGAKEVASFTLPISVDLLAPVAKDVIENLDSAKGEGVDLLRILREAVERHLDPGSAPAPVPGVRREPLPPLQLRIGQRDHWLRPNDASSRTWAGIGPGVHLQRSRQLLSPRSARVPGRSWFLALLPWRVAAPDAGPGGHPRDHRGPGQPSQA